jgi:hypothetical protein
VAGWKGSTRQPGRAETYVAISNEQGKSIVTTVTPRPAWQLAGCFRTR